MNNSLHELKVNKNLLCPFKEKWNQECQKTFDTLREKLTTAPVLGYVDYTKPSIVETDATHDGLGAVLSQEQDGRRRVIAYSSRRLRPPEKKCRIIVLRVTSAEVGCHREVQKLPVRNRIRGVHRQQPPNSPSVSQVRSNGTEMGS